MGTQGQFKIAKSNCYPEHLRLEKPWKNESATQEKDNTEALVDQTGKQEHLTLNIGIKGTRQQRLHVQENLTDRHLENFYEINDATLGAGDAWSITQVPSNFLPAPVDPRQPNASSYGVNGTYALDLWESRRSLECSKSAYSNLKRLRPSNNRQANRRLESENAERDKVSFRVQKQGAAQDRHILPSRRLGLVPINRINRIAIHTEPPKSPQKRHEAGLHRFTNSYNPFDSIWRSFAKR